MKNIAIVSVVAALFSTAAFAGGLGNTNTEALSFSTKNVDLTLSATNEQLDVVSVGVNVLPTTFAGLDGIGNATLAYNDNTDQIAATLGYSASKTFGKITAYGTVAEAYTKTAHATDGTWSFQPKAGVSLAATDKLAVYTEVGSNFWNASNGYSNEGQYATIGVKYTVADKITLNPGITRTFNTSNNESNLSLKAAVVF